MSSSSLKKKSHRTAIHGTYVMYYSRPIFFSSCRPSLSTASLSLQPPRGPSCCQPLATRRPSRRRRRRKCPSCGEERKLSPPSTTPTRRSSRPQKSKRRQCSSPQHQHGQPPQSLLHPAPLSLSTRHVFFFAHNHASEIMVSC